MKGFKTTSHSSGLRQSPSHQRLNPPGASLEAPSSSKLVRRSSVNPLRPRTETETGDSYENYMLRQARYGEQRKKLGLAYVPKNSAAYALKARDYDQKRSDMIEYIQSHFTRKECVYFVPKVDKKQLEKLDANAVKDLKCHCGERASKHIKGAAGITEFLQTTTPDVIFKNIQADRGENAIWDAKNDIRALETTAFGKIDFLHEGNIGGRKPAKYVRLADDTDIDKLLELMRDHWHMNKPYEPSLVITVIGGAKNFNLDGKKKEVFNRGLVEAAQTTHAWIITSGCNMGVMKAVGEAVAQGQTFSWDQSGSMTHTLRCIGIAPWGYIERREALELGMEHGSWNATYKVNNVIKSGQPVSLNPDHTHFVFVDDGYRLRYGGADVIRAQLEHKLAAPEAEGGLGIPVVLVVLEGGEGAITDTASSLEHGTPVVLCEGTGRAADILAYAYTHTMTTRKGGREMKDRYKVVLRDMITNAWGRTWEERGRDVEKLVTTYTDKVMECCQKEKMITVFDMNKDDSLDMAILSALLKGKDNSTTGQLLEQLKLALTWNRSDIAEEKIFSQNVTWPTGTLDDVMNDALLDDKVDFVRVLLANGVVLSEFLTVWRLRKLYNEAPTSSHLRSLLPRVPVYTLKDVSKLMRKLLTKHTNKIYTDDNDMNKVLADENYEPTDADGNKDSSFRRPFEELFLWAVLMNRAELAKFLWQRCEVAISSALIASMLYGSMAQNVATYDTDQRVSYVEHKNEFESLAVEVLNECQQRDPQKASLMVEIKHPEWGDQTCLELAAAAEDREFLSTVCCQNSLNLMWKRGVSSRWPKMTAGLLIPPLVPCIIRFDNMGDDEDTLTPWQKMLTFYTAPATKFTFNVIMYMTFLLLYSYMLLFGFRHHISITEYIVLFWIFTLLCEELREILFLSKASSFRQRIRDWWNFSPFNRIDGLVILLAILGFCLRLSPQHFLWAKTVYSINCVFFFIRVLRDYTVHSYLGPKLVMIVRMMQELIMYLLILAVFLLAYGISTLAMMYPIRDFYTLVFKDILYYPYWQVYGELFLDELHGDTDDCKGVNSTVMHDGTPCPQFSPLVPILTAGYLLVGNVLLLNLLIAIFTNVFDEVQTNSVQIWKYGMYFLVIEYDSKPSLAPPFVIFEHIYLILKLCFTKLVRENDTNEKESTAFQSQQMTMLVVFEKECMKRYFQRQKLSETTNIEKVDQMAKQIEEERQLEQAHFEAEQEKGVSSGVSPRALTRRPKSFLSRSSVMDAMKEGGKAEQKINNLNLPDDGKDGVDHGKLGSIAEDQGQLDLEQSAQAARVKAIMEKYHQQKQGSRVSMTVEEETQAAPPHTAGPSTADPQDDVITRPQQRRTLSMRSAYQLAMEDMHPRDVTLQSDVMPPSVAAELEKFAREAQEGREEIQREMNVVTSRMTSMETRLAQMEETTRNSLYNIEALLRNAVFYRAPPARPAARAATARSGQHPRAWHDDQDSSDL